MNGLLLLTACLDDRAFFTDGVSMQLIEQLAINIEMSVLGAASVEYIIPKCSYVTINNDASVACGWNASYTDKDCADMRQANLDATTFGALDGRDNLTFCNLDLDCSD